ncbi:V-type proton ATPase 116 kDa subunit a [Hyposmocoma kahamanoa]|uniref:V-type proton ATPase 116 kDa subunit a n=1 Tax=Hyposmocoma kahamanoa TaxID=1477025 RepID=UPI000E6D923B|nr:V-type proton ATPase 116 kDa subunit a [Hyposmocoma kahamanoa]
MGAMFRSEEMALCQLFIQPEAAYTSVSELGEAGTVQFRDLNEEVNAFQRKFVNEVRRCDEMERKLRYIEVEVHKDGVHIPSVREPPRAPNPREIIDLEAHLEKTENEILELSHNAVNLKQNYLELTELKHVLEKTEAFFAAQEEIGMDSLTKSLIPDESGQPQQAAAHGRLGFVAGVVQRERVPAFERMLWRISRGNVFLRRAELDKPLEDPKTGNEIYKTVFVAFFQGEQLKSRIKKVCTGFHASLYPCPPSNTERQDMVKGVRTRLADLDMVLNQTRDHRQRVLLSVAKELPSWLIMVRKMKAIYHTLNLFNMDVTKKCLIGECWVPTADLPNVQKALADGSNACGSAIPSFLNCIETEEEPPTFNRTNRFTRGFQNLIDAYGVASYRECNPALYTTITFPFLFAVMFGDFGHGCIMAFFGAWMVMKEVSLSAKKSTNEIWNIFFAGRYIILLMGCFSMYTGLVYNDLFSKSMNIFGSSWTVPYDQQTLETYGALTLDPKDAYLGEPYFIGIDPVWQTADNKIIFLNSYKMKLSIIFGVTHMIFGVCMSVVNYNFFKRRYSIILEFLPQIVFLCLLFLYMVFMMFYKWIAYSCTHDTPVAYSQDCAPSVLILFINMMLFSSTEPNKDCNEFMFEAQGTLQLVFVLIALCCIPVMLLGKPLYILCTKNNKKNSKPEQASNGSVNQGIEMQEQTDISESATPAPAKAEKSGGGDHEEEPFSEIMIHQAIHTIEYVLSTISHTASYLRLWALSLAHAELSEVLWNMVLTFGLKDHGYIGSIKLYVAFAFWALFTLAILVMMEGLSAFLHTLRLHWVEFMTKFYAGLGYIFQPFCFKTILEQEENKDD